MVKRSGETGRHLYNDPGKARSEPVAQPVAEVAERQLGRTQRRVLHQLFRRLEGDPEKRIIRLNLSFKNFGPSLSRACFFLGTADKFEVQVTSGEGTMQILRSDDPGYLVIKISNEYFLQIFQTSDRPTRKYKALLTILKSSKKYSLVLEGIDGTTAAGRAPTCYELSLPK